jgi:hypothetical protein
MFSSKILSAAINKSNVIWVMLYCWLSVSSSAAATYYVAKTGVNSNPCSTAAPRLTIKKAVSLAVSPGDLVIVKAGSYSETVTSWSSGAVGKPITVKANPSDDVV